MIPDKPAGDSASAAASCEDVYWELDADLHPETEELWGAFCYEHGALGAELLEEDGPRRRVRHFFAEEPDATGWRVAFAGAYPGVPPPLDVRSQRQRVQPFVGYDTEYQDGNRGRQEKQGVRR